MDKYSYTGPINDNIILSPAECRCVVYQNEALAKQYWIKGNKFTVRSLLNLITEESAETKNEIHNTTLENELNQILTKGGVSKRVSEISTAPDSNILVSRLAPQDYHRFHSPVNGKIIYIDNVNGNYYSVQPAVVNSKTNVFGRNKRVNVWMVNPILGVVIVCIIGATCVGTISLTSTKEPDKALPATACSCLIGTTLKAGDQLGFFEFGGSTLVTIIPGPIKWCNRLLELSKESIEMFVHVKEYLGNK